MNNSKLIKILGMVATIGGVAATLLTDWVNEKKMDEKSMRLLTQSLPHLMMKKTKSPNKGSFSLS